MAGALAASWPSLLRQPSPVTSRWLPVRPAVEAAGEAGGGSASSLPGDAGRGRAALLLAAACAAARVGARAARLQLRGRRARCRLGSGGAPVDQRLSELRALRARDLKRELELLGLSTTGCLDKESLLELLDSRGEAAVRGQAARAEAAAHRKADAQDSEREARWKAADRVFGVGLEEEGWPEEDAQYGSTVLRRMEEAYPDAKARRSQIHQKRRKAYRPYNR
mmetsp:Transcript_36121/g.100278  ORF Transcript_36121/g.100278 Transcript_36121/m.100278 type:complete len:223 (-) Transcript_36121:71-739(-)